MTKYAITGIAGSGKDEVGRVLAQELEVKTYALAYPIKKLASLLFNFPIEEIEDRASKELQLLRLVDVTSLEAAGMYYQEIGLGVYQEFHDAWEEWVGLLELHVDPSDTEHYRTRLSIRQILQRLGTEWGRSKCDTIWLEIVPEDVVITDVRFDNEAEFLRSRGYVVLEVFREGHTPIEQSGHASENGILQSLVDVVINNDGTLKDLHEKVIFLVVSNETIGVI